MKQTLKQSYLSITLMSIALSLSACGSSSSPFTNIKDVDTPSQSDKTVPENVKLNEVTSNSKDSITATWTKASDNNTASDKLKYQLHASTDKNFNPNHQTLIFSGTNITSAEIKDKLKGGKTYYVRLVVIDKDGNTKNSNALIVKVASKDPVDNSDTVDTDVSQKINLSGRIPATLFTKGAQVRIANVKKPNEILKTVKSKNQTFDFNEVEVSKNDNYVIESFVLDDNGNPNKGSLKLFITGEELLEKSSINVSMLTDMAYRHLSYSVDDLNADNTQSVLDEFSKEIIQDVTNDNAISYADLLNYDASAEQKSQLKIDESEILTLLMPLVLEGINDDELLKQQLKVLSPQININGGLFQEAPTSTQSIKLGLIPKKLNIQYLLNDNEISSNNFQVSSSGANLVESKVALNDDLIYYASTQFVTYEPQEVQQTSQQLATGDTLIDVINDNEAHELGGLSVLVSKDNAISPDTIKVNALPDIFIPTDNGLGISEVFDLSPSGSEFETALVVSVPVNLDYIANNDSIFIARKSEDGTIERIAPERVDSEKGIVTFKTSHFSQFQVKYDCGFLGSGYISGGGNCLYDNSTQTVFDDIRVLSPDFASLSDDRISQILNTRPDENTASVYKIYSDITASKKIRNLIEKRDFIGALKVRNANIEVASKLHQAAKEIMLLDEIYGAAKNVYNLVKSAGEGVLFLSKSAEILIGSMGIPTDLKSTSIKMPLDDANIYNKMFNFADNLQLYNYYVFGDIPAGKHDINVFGDEWPYIKQIIDDLKQRNENFNPSKSDKLLAEYITAINKDIENAENPKLHLYTDKKINTAKTYLANKQYSFDFNVSNIGLPAQSTALLKVEFPNSTIPSQEKEITLYNQGKNRNSFTFTVPDIVDKINQEVRISIYNEKVAFDADSQLKTTLSFVPVSIIQDIRFDTNLPRVSNLRGVIDTQDNEHLCYTFDYNFIGSKNERLFPDDVAISATLDGQKIENSNVNNEYCFNPEQIIKTPSKFKNFQLSITANDEDMIDKIGTVTKQFNLYKALQDFVAQENQNSLNMFIISPKDKDNDSCFAKSMDAQSNTFVLESQVCAKVGLINVAKINAININGKEKRTGFTDQLDYGSYNPPLRTDLTDVFTEYRSVAITESLKTNLRNFQPYINVTYIDGSEGYIKGPTINVSNLELLPENDVDIEKTKVNGITSKPAVINKPTLVTVKGESLPSSLVLVSDNSNDFCNVLSASPTNMNYSCVFSSIGTRNLTAQYDTKTIGGATKLEVMAENAVDLPPVINSIVASGNQVGGGKVSLMADVTDQNNDTITYEWFVRKVVDGDDVDVEILDGSGTDTISIELPVALDDKNSVVATLVAKDSQGNKDIQSKVIFYGKENLLSKVTQLVGSLVPDISGITSAFAEVYIEIVDSLSQVFEIDTKADADGKFAVSSKTSPSAPAIAAGEYKITTVTKGTEDKHEIVENTGVMITKSNFIFSETATAGDNYTATITLPNCAKSIAVNWGDGNIDQINQETTASCDIEHTLAHTFTEAGLKRIQTKVTMPNEFEYHNNVIVEVNASEQTTTSTLTATGITKCGDYAYGGGSGKHNNDLDCSKAKDADGDPIPAGQDGHVQAGLPLSYAIRPRNGSKCILDKSTGLIWEQKTDDGGLRDKDNTYTWYNPDSKTNGSDAGKNNGAGTQNGGTCQGSNCDTHAYIQALNNANYCGYSDWRMPTYEELTSIVDYGRYNPAINPIFTNTQNSYYWSSSPDVYGSNYAWGVYFYNGYDDSRYKNGGYYVRAVRSE